MTRTFHAKLDKKTLLFCLLPSTIMAVYFFWIKWPLPEFVFMVFMVIIVERLIHTVYVVTDDGRLIISKGRFSRSVVINLSDIKSVEPVKTSAIFPFRRNDVVGITLKDGAIRLVSPFPADEFCHFVMKQFRKEEKEI